MVTETKKERAFPASFGQERIWLSNQLDPGSPVHNVPCQVRQDLPLTEHQWRTALRQVVARQEALRTSFRMAGGVLTQVVHAEVPVELDVHDLRDLPAEPRRRRADELAVMAARRVIPLDTPPPWRARLCRLSDAEWLLTFVAHRAVFDAASVPILTHELNEACTAVFEGREPRLPELPIQYTDYSLWQREQLAGLGGQLDYWRQRLAGLPPAHSLPTDRPRPGQLSFAGDQVDFELPEGLLDRVEAVGARLSASPFMVLLAAYAALLHRMSRSDDVVVGVPLAGRDRPELAPLIGMFVNQLAIRVDCGDVTSFAELVARVRTEVLGGIEHGLVPFQLVAQAVGVTRDPGVQALYQIGFDFVPDAGIEPVLYATAKDDLALELTRDTGRLRYRTGLLDRTTAESLVDRYLRLLTTAVDDPSLPVSELPLLSEPERDRVLEEWNATEVPYPHRQTVHELFERQVRRDPDAVAVDFGGGRLTYAGLNARANRVAHRLRGLGAGPGTIVGVSAPNSPELVVGLLGVLKSGAAYVPLDPGLPAQRQALIVTDAAIPVVLTTGESTLDTRTLALDDPRQWAHQPAGDPAPTAGPRDAAYVIYTSGSTGRPKGVLIEHRSVNAYLAWARRAYPSLAGRALLHTSPSFDLTVTTLFGPLTAGGSIVDGTAAGPTFVKATPTHLAVLPDELCPSKDLVLGGEALTGETVTRWRERSPECVVTNEYGPTEATVGCIAYQIEPGQSLPPGPVSIGRPIENARAYVLDERLRPVPPGVAGQLWVAGPQLARGYLGRPELTAERFQDCPFSVSGERMYATGDLARWRHDGTLDFFGRIDDQVKLHGYRIEPGEIEAALRALPGVRDAAVAVREDTLVGYLVGESAGVTEALRQTLPDYMVPTTFVVLAALPVASSGKLDRSALPAPPLTSDAPYTAPRTATEELVAEVLAELLGLDKIGIHDDFFALGGNSLLEVQAITRIRKQVDVNLPVRGLLSFTTVAGLAAEIERRLAEDMAGLCRVNHQG